MSLLHKLLVLVIKHICHSTRYHSNSYIRIKESVWATDCNKIELHVHYNCPTTENYPTTSYPTILLWFVSPSSCTGPFPILFLHQSPLLQLTGYTISRDPNAVLTIECSFITIISSLKRIQASDEMRSLMPLGARWYHTISMQYNITRWMIE